MKVLAIVGSPRPGGNTETLARIALEELESEGMKTELVHLAKKRIEPCDGCRNCLATGTCHIQDDFPAIYESVLEADGLILASPVYYGAATPQMSAFISRFYFSGKEKPLRHKVGGPIVVARRAGHNFTLAQLLFFFLIHEMIVPGSTYWNIAFGREKGEVGKDEEGVRTIRNFAQNMAWLIRKTR